MLNTGNYVTMDYEAEVVFDFEPTKQTEIDDIDFRIWLAQLTVWGLIVIVVKITLFFFQLLVAPILEIMSSVLIGWLRIYPKVKLIIIMILWPLLLNAVQFWIQDNILKAKKKKNIEFSKMLTIKGRHSMYHDSEEIQMHKFDASKRAKSKNDRTHFPIDV